MTKEEILSTFDIKGGAWFAYNEGIQVGYNEAYNSLRNQAAIAAMQSIISNEDLFCRIEEAVNHEGVYDAIASDAVKMSNALIEELKKK